MLHDQHWVTEQGFWNGIKKGLTKDALLNTSILFLISTSVNPMEFLDSLGHSGLGYPKRETVSVVGHALPASSFSR